MLFSLAEIKIIKSNHIFSKFLLSTNQNRALIIRKFLSFLISTNQNWALLRLTIIKQHKVSQNLGHFFEFVQIIVDIGTMFHCFILFCSEESNLNLGRFVLLDRDTNLSSFQVAMSYTLLQLSSSWSIVYSLSEVSSKIGTSPRFSASWLTVFLIAEIASPSFSPR